MSIVPPRLCAAALGLCAGLAIAAPGLAADPITVTDLAGRTVTVPQPVERLILGEGRQIYLLAALKPDDPFARVVGWRDDFRTTDLNGWNQYLERFPGMADIPVFGNPGGGDFSVEQAVALQPDILLLNLEVERAVAEIGLIDILEGLGVPVVFIDFRERPFENTGPSIALLGRILGLEDRAAEVNAFIDAEVARVRDRLAGYDGPRPRVFIERAAGLSDGCCNTFGHANLGRLVGEASGLNIAAELVPGTFGTISAEQIAVADPEVLIFTGSNWSLYDPDNIAVGLGAGADPAELQDRLKGLIERPGFGETAAVRSGRVHSIWHQFYNSPYSFAALQAFAKWLHPDLFADLDPDATFAEFHRRFLPVDYIGGYWASLEPAAP